MNKETLDKANKLMLQLDCLNDDLSKLNSISDFKAIPEARLIFYDSYNEKTIAIDIQDNLMYSIISLAKESISMDIKDLNKQFDKL